jgi:DNA-binding winged helix-turn-helix (wHTH) protein/TolB-like protein/Tfp pilus assembly protein PilF
MPSLGIGDWSVDASTNQIRRGSEVLRLEPKAVDLLMALSARAGEVVSRDELLAQVWSGVVVGDDVLTQAVIKLRKALGDTSKEPRYIETIPKRGYRLIAVVTSHAADAASSAPATSVPIETHAPPRPAVARLRWIAAATVLAAVLGAGHWLYTRDAAESTASSAAALQESIANARIESSPKVVVYPFKESESDPWQTLLARGITARLVTDLGRIPDIRVISLQDATAPGGAEPRSETRLGDYAVRGELQSETQRGGGKIRLYVHLTNAISGEALWSEQYDRPYGDLLSLQDELTKQILDRLRITVGDQERRRQARPYTRNLEAYEHFLRAQSALLVRRKSDNDAARGQYLKAIELDPTFARAHAGLALTYAADQRNGWTSDGPAALAKALALAKSAREMDPDIPEPLFALAFVNMERGKPSEAIDNLRDALRLNPSYADAYALMAGIETYSGRPQQTIPLIRTAMRLRPDSGYLYLMILGRASFFLDDMESAALYLRQAVARNPDDVEAHLYLAATLARAGKGDQAMWEAEEIRTLEPAFSMRQWLTTYPMTDGGQRDRLAHAVEGLKL